MNITTVESGTLASVAYDDVRETLQLEFRSGAIYRYSGVPLSVCEGLLSAPSRGRYFNEVIRGRFPYAPSAQAWRGAA
jgi:hypothetical protein